MSPIDAAYAFAAAINRRSPEELSSLMTDDHVFIDSLGNRVEGKDRMTSGWIGYYRMVPDFSITIDETFAAGDVVVMLGTAQGTLSAGGELRPENRWQAAAAWRVLVRGELIAEWRIYADNDPIRQLIARGK
jgi:ketosteroid isomerase-like protein